jgi:hypothetical protein
MAVTYEPIATTTLVADTATITFSSIPGTYTDLRLILVARTDRATTGNDSVIIRFNSDTGTNYSRTTLSGNGTTVTSSQTTTTASLSIGLATRNSNTSGIFALNTIDIFSYAGSTNKTILSTASADINGSGDVQSIVALWRNTSAITDITLLLSSTYKYLTNTTATLYGIKAA